MDYGLDPCMVKSIEGHVVTSCPCIGDIKVLQTLFALSFASEVLAGLRAAHCLCSTVVVGFGDSCVCITQLVTVSSLLNTLLFIGKNISVFTM